MLGLGLHVSAHDWRRPKKPGSLLNSYKYAPPAPSPNRSIPKAREHLKSFHCCEVVMGNLLGREVMPSNLLCCEVVSGNLRGRLGRQISFVCEVVLGNLRGRICQQISFLCKIVMGDLRGRLCRQILLHGYAAKPRVHTNMVVRKAHMLSMTPMWKDHGRLSRQIFQGSCGYSSEAREALPQNRWYEA
ncbi:unnamed protein product [Microthlaspi erraticum]|uniref:Uncharacterized protein n=1 Tax=Microthlaspi erraticum TaxID=1685480 RepID=A0A6D2HPD1_9BRAS|nr:unnamed protein product [Microthlaspi erraticum]